MHGETLESFEGSEEQPEAVAKKTEVSLVDKNLFQIEVFKQLISEGKLNKKDFDGMQRYGEIISGLVDETDNYWIRDLIVQKKIKEAVNAIITAIKIETDRSGEI